MANISVILNFHFTMQLNNEYCLIIDSILFSTNESNLETRCNSDNIILDWLESSYTWIKKANTNCDIILMKF